LTEELARAFAAEVSETTTTMAGRRYLVVRHFADFLATFDPRASRLDPRAVPSARNQPPPFIFTLEELDSLLSQASRLSSTRRAWNRAVHAMIGLAASSGLRRGEVLGLDQSDVDLHSGTLLVRQSKFHKDRLAPVHSSTLEVLRTYAAVRTAIPDARAEPAFFVTSGGRRFQGLQIERVFRQLVSSVDLHAPQGKRPTFRSLRHTFAVQRLVAWYRAGANVQALLPSLATYMGHVHYTSTSYYLTATAELLGVAAERLAITAHEASDAKNN